MLSRDGAGRKIALVRRLLTLLVPPLCVACRGPARADTLVCAACLRGLPWLRGWRCARCGQPRHRAGGCPGAACSFDRAWAPLRYEGVAQDVVRALKFDRSLAVADLMAGQIVANLPEDLVRLPVVPVPAQRLRRRVRGFDPAGELAGAVARRAGVPLLDVLRRTDLAPRQVGAGRLERRAGRLAVRAAGAVPQRAMLVDDVHTTGATLDACAAALRAAGARSVAAVTYARTL